MGLNQLFNKDLMFCLHAKDQTDLFEQVASLLEAVSYTHLDVYKRQIP